MARILGVDIPNNKRVVISLTYLYGIGKYAARKILKDVNIDENVKTKDLSEEELSKLSVEIEKNYVVEGQLHRQIKQNIQRLKDIEIGRASCRERV